MKLLPILIATLLLAGCVSYDYNINENPEYSSWIGQTCITNEDLYLSLAIGSHLYVRTPYTLAHGGRPSYEGEVIGKIPAASEIIITEAFRERDPNGDYWDYFLGTTKNPKTNERIEFEYMIGLVDSWHKRTIPFSFNPNQSSNQSR